MGNGTGQLNLGPFKLSFGKWAVQALSVLVVLGVAGWLTIKFSEQLDTDRVRVSKEFILQSEEMQRHYIESPAKSVSLFEDANSGSIKIDLYASDLCIAQTRTSKYGITSTRFMVDPARVGAPPPPSIASGVLGDMVEVTLAGGTGGERCPWEYACSRNGTCSDHTGDFSNGRFTWCWGQRNGCWVEVWRRFPDGCTHTQWWNECYSTWGPVEWRCCLH